ncbi:MAG TPA: nitrogen fixation protein NifZ [Polyangiaceae bacterium]|nr:nitrogen fixation protein NifZ [Polyangiaceae bacterium]
MGLGKEEEIETRGEPLFRPGVKVVSTKYVKNDGTYAGRDIGEVLVRKGDIGYVRDIGTFLQRYYIYAVEFIETGVVVGMRGRELEALDANGKPIKRLKTNRSVEELEPQ